MMIKILLSVLMSLNAPVSWANDGKKAAKHAHALRDLTIAGFTASAMASRPKFEKDEVIRFWREHGVNPNDTAPIKVLGTKVLVDGSEVKYDSRWGGFAYRGRTLRVTPKDPIHVIMQKIFEQLMEKKSASFSLLPEAQAENATLTTVYKAAGISSVLAGLLYPLVSQPLGKAALALTASGGTIVFVVALFLSIVVPTDASGAELPRVKSASCNVSGIRAEIGANLIVITLKDGKLSWTANGEPQHISPDDQKTYVAMVKQCAEVPEKDELFANSLQMMLEFQQKEEVMNLPQPVADTPAGT